MVCSCELHCYRCHSCDFMISADVGRTEIERVEQKVQGKVFYIKNLRVDIEILASAEKDAKTKKALEQLAEKYAFLTL